MIAILSAPSNLGLRPPQPSSVPGCAKAPEALRAAGLYKRMGTLGAIDAGLVLPGRYVDDPDPGHQHLRNHDAIVDHAKRLAARLTSLLDAGHSPLVLGGDCSLVVGVGLALSRRGRHGLAHLDGHTDFRHPSNSTQCTSLAGEDLAAAIGLHWDTVANIDGFGPYFDARRVVHAGCRNDDEHLTEVRSLIAKTLTSSELRSDISEASRGLANILEASSADGYWLHVDVDILDPGFLSAVDSPIPDGLTPNELRTLLATLAPGALGAHVTVFDPDLDPSGAYADLLTDVLIGGLTELGGDINPR